MRHIKTFVYENTSKFAFFDKQLFNFVLDYICKTWRCQNGLQNNSNNQGIIFANRF